MATQQRRQQRQRAPDLIGDYAAASVNASRYHARGMAVPAEITEKLNYYANLAQATFQGHELQGLLQAVRERQHQIYSAQVQQEQQMKQQKFSYDTNRMLQHSTSNITRDGKGLTHAQLQEYRATGKYTPEVRRPSMSVKAMKEGAKKVGLSLPDYEERLDKLSALRKDHGMDSPQYTSALKKAGIIDNLVDAWDSHGLAYTAEKRLAKDFEEPEKVELNHNADLRMDILDNAYEVGEVGSDEKVPEWLKEEDGMRGDVARAFDLVEEYGAEDYD